MNKSGNDFTVIIDLPKDRIVEFKYKVDNAWRYNEGLQVTSDDNKNNILLLNNYESPHYTWSYDSYQFHSDDEYSTKIPSDLDYSFEPPVLPQLFKSNPLNVVTKYAVL